MTIGASESTAVESKRSTRGFLGWRIVGVGFVANFLSGAITLSTFGNFVDPVSMDFGVPRASVGLGMSIAFLVMGMLGPFAGAWLDRGWARSMMAGGSLIAGTGLILLSQATTLRQAAILFCGVVGIGAALFGIMPSMALTSNWFIKRRGLAIGIAVAGATIASYVAPATAQYFIDVYGWRTAVMVFGAVPEISIRGPPLSVKMPRLPGPLTTPRVLKPPWLPFFQKNASFCTTMSDATTPLPVRTPSSREFSPM